MLINTIKRSFQDMIRQSDIIQPIVAVPNIQAAANAGNFSQSELQARRLRRQRRLGREGLSGGVGWSVRTW